MHFFNQPASQYPCGFRIQLGALHLARMVMPTTGTEHRNNLLLI